MNREDTIGISVGWGRTVNTGNYENFKPIVTLPAAILTDDEFADCSNYENVVDLLFGKTQALIEREITFQQLYQTYTTTYKNSAKWQRELETLETRSLSDSQVSILRRAINQRLEEKRQEEEEKRQKKLKELDSIIDSTKAALTEGEVWDTSLMSHLVRRLFHISSQERRVLQRMTVGQIINLTPGELLPLLSSPTPPAPDEVPF